VGLAVRYAVDKGRDLSQLSLDELREFSAMIGPDVAEVLTLEGSTEARRHVGGTAPRQVRRALAQARRRLVREAALRQAMPGRTLPR
jgi:argininosuccinate lyase